jgi:hypothetical protein
MPVKCIALFHGKKKIQSVEYWQARPVGEQHLTGSSSFILSKAAGKFIFEQVKPLLKCYFKNNFIFRQQQLQNLQKKVKYLPFHILQLKHPDPNAGPSFNHLTNAPVSQALRSCAGAQEAV